MSKSDSLCSSSSSEREVSVDMEDLSWFHPDASRHVAESLLMQNGQDGSFLVRKSSKSGDLALSVRCKDSVKHYPISWTGKEYSFGMNKYKTIKELANHFERQPVISGESGILSLLKYPYPREVEEPGVYEAIRIHAELGERTSRTPVRSYALATKEGYLTKQGWNVKNWKTRWFVLHRNEFKYFKDRKDEEPIRTIDLAELSKCEKDDTQKKENCFKIVLPWRTFYLYAATEEEMNEWMEIIRWKMEHKNAPEG